MKHSTIHKAFSDGKNILDDIILNFDTKGDVFGDQDRNSLKTFDFQDIILNVKSFKVPNLINRIAYKFIRKSKARRSYEYANKLQALGIGTPKPVAYYEFSSLFLFKNSFYISEHLNYDLTYRELTIDLDYPEHEKIVRAFTRFTFNLHEKGIHFLDHSPGNTLIKKNGDKYEFYLVDLNRMEFKSLDFYTRIKNFSRLTIHESIIKMMSDEYAKCLNEDYSKVFDLMLDLTNDFQKKFHRKQNFKKKIKSKNK